MKGLLSLILILTTSMAQAAPKQELPKCQQVAEQAAVKANKKKFGAETSECGSKLLHLGDQLETYLVCITDETDPSEWIVTVKQTVYDAQHKVAGHCKVDYVGYAVDAATPDFDDQE